MAPWRRNNGDRSAQSTAIAVVENRTTSPTPASKTSPNAAASGGGQALAKYEAAPGNSSALGGAVGAAATAVQRKQASVVEMLEYVKGLDIDPVKECDMLWIAEEAFNAPLPPGWSEHTDEQARVYFHNIANGESAWRHPMDDMFREIVSCQRRVLIVGGFWEVEDEIAELEENIRKNLADWMELFDEHGEKFFYNRRTDESRFDDPRMAVYHSLYARIKMIAKMKERLPLLARAPRPEQTTDQERELKRRLEEEEENYLRKLVKIQSLARLIIARRKVRQARAQAVIQKGPQPLRGKLRLRMEKLKPGGDRELVLSQTTPHRRTKAATKIQARMRGVLVRKQFRPLVQHRAYLGSRATKIQSVARVWLAKRRVHGLRKNRKAQCAIKIQKVYRGYRDRHFINGLRAERLRFDWMLKCVLTIQCGIRMCLAYRVMKTKRIARYSAQTKMLQRQSKMFLAMQRLHELKLNDEPLQCFLAHAQDSQVCSVTPWTWQLWAAPWSRDCTNAERRVSAVGKSFKNLFQNVDLDTYRHVAATRIQAKARGRISRRRRDQQNDTGASIVNEITSDAWRTLSERGRAATKIQAVTRGVQTRQQNFVAQRQATHLKQKEKSIVKLQASIRLFTAQASMRSMLEEFQKHKAATIIQARWRGWLARRHIERLNEEALWPVKGWFEYTATGRDVVKVAVRWLPNPSFDDFRYFVEYGTREELRKNLASMQSEVDNCVSNYLNDRAHRTDLSAAGQPLPPEQRSALQQAGMPLPVTVTAPKVPAASPKDKPSATRPQEEEAEEPGETVMSEDAGVGTKKLGVKHIKGFAIGDTVSVNPGGSTQEDHVIDAFGSILIAQPLSFHHRIGEVVRKVERPVAQVEASSKEVATEVDALPAPAAASLASQGKSVPVDESAPAEEAPKLAGQSAIIKQASTLPSPAAKSTLPPSEGEAASTKAAPPKAKAEIHRASSSEIVKTPKAKPGPVAEPLAAAAVPVEIATDAATPKARASVRGAPAVQKSTLVGLVASASADTTVMRSEPDSPPVGEHPSLMATVPQRKAPSARQRAKKRSPAMESPPPDDEKAATQQAFELPAILSTRRKSPQLFQPTRERVPLVDDTRSQSLAHQFLAEAPCNWTDVRPDGSPLPPEKMPTPVPPSPMSTRGVGASTKASAIRLSQSTSALDDIKFEQETDPDSKMKDTGSKMKRKTYGGTLSGKTFVRNPAESVDDLNDTDKQAVLSDIDEHKARMAKELAKKQRKHKTRRNKEEAAAREKEKAMNDEAQELLDARGSRKVDELKKWLKRKEEESRAKKERDAETMNQVLEKEMQKSESLAHLEQVRLKDREKRLRIADRQRAKFDAQLAKCGPPRGMPPKMGRRGAPFAQQNLAQLSPNSENQQEPSSGSASAPELEMPKRMVHRHIHHHVHYHEGPDGPDEVGPEVQHQLEAASEAKVYQQLKVGSIAAGPPAQTMPMYGQRAGPRGAAASDPLGQDPTMQRFRPNGDDPRSLMRTQDAFQQGRRPGGLINYNQNVDRAFGSYADSGRPRYGRAVCEPVGPAGASWS